MDKIELIISFFCLLVVAHGTAESRLSDHISVRLNLDNLDTEEGDELDLFDFPSWTSERGSKILVNVDGLGAVGDGIADDTQVNVVDSFTYMHVLLNLYVCFWLFNFKMQASPALNQSSK